MSSRVIDFIFFTSGSITIGCAMNNGLIGLGVFLITIGLYNSSSSGY